MKTHSKNIELRRLAIDAESEVPSMVRELEGVESDIEAPNRRLARFLLAGTKLAFGSKKAGVRN
jgi:hypothetical protein